ncbi:cold-responsive protein kinase 1-like [Silene latifolia]|uniref:cold-responsive protein kinase 1-like n=1 Tax=Silene latifolia TaxID=37657 RepID=UPI003D76BAE9
MPCFPIFCCKGEEPSAVDEEFAAVQNVQLYSYKELRAATDDFSVLNKIGEGGFGPVYKAKLKHGRLAAIKVLSTESKQGVREFLTEIKLISETQHENLVKLYGCCVEGKHRILVYNYLENNCLAQTLLGNQKCSIEFSWQTRRKICIGIARGLAFLHEEVRPHIVHRDIKASNILLDKDLTPKISDFGLAKLMPPNATHVSTRVAGTLGYLAPEYAVRGQLTRKADVYSFGVLLLEIVCGRSNTNMRLPHGERFLLERIWERYQQRELVVMVDDMLNGDYDAEEACNFLKIGLLCTQDAPKLRPSMSTVVKMLTGRINIDDVVITAPGLISDLSDLKVRDPHNDASGSSSKDTTSSHSAASTGVVQTTFTAIYDRSV